MSVSLFRVWLLLLFLWYSWILLVILICEVNSNSSPGKWRVGAVEGGEVAGTFYAAHVGKEIYNSLQSPDSHTQPSSSAPFELHLFPFLSRPPSILSPWDLRFVWSTFFYVFPKSDQKCDPENPAEKEILRVWFCVFHHPSHGKCRFSDRCRLSFSFIAYFLHVFSHLPNCPLTGKWEQIGSDWKKLLENKHC